MAGSKEAGQAALQHCVKVGCCTAATLAIASIFTGIIFLHAPCDMALAEWNLVASAILAILATAMFCALRVYPSAVEMAYKCMCYESDFQTIFSQGYGPASSCLGLVVAPIALLAWDIHGVASVRFGTCPSSAPLLFDISLAGIVIQLVLLVASISYVAHCSGVTWETIVAAVKHAYVIVENWLKSAAVYIWAKVCAIFCYDTWVHIGSAIQDIFSWERMKNGAEWMSKSFFAMLEYMYNSVSHGAHMVVKVCSPHYWISGESERLLG